MKFSTKGLLETEIKRLPQTKFETTFCTSCHLIFTDEYRTYDFNTCFTYHRLLLNDHYSINRIMITLNIFLKKPGNFYQKKGCFLLSILNRQLIYTVK